MSGPWFAASYLVLWLLVAGLFVLVLALYREVGQLYLRASGVERDGPRLGSRMDAVETLAGTLALAAGEHLIVFGLPGCSYCEALLPELADFARVHSSSMTTHFLLAVQDERMGNPMGDSSAVRWAMVPQDAAAQHRIRVSPFANAISDGVVRAKGVVNGIRDLDRLVARAAARP